MSTPDPRAEIRDMIAAKIHAAECGWVWHPGDEYTHYEDLADAVLELFPEVWQHHASSDRVCYVLRTAPEATERTDT